MNTRSKGTARITRVDSGPAGAELRLKELGIKLPAPLEPFGTYVEAVRTGNPLFLIDMLPMEGREAKYSVASPVAASAFEQLGIHRRQNT